MIGWALLLLLLGATQVWTFLLLRKLLDSNQALIEAFRFERQRASEWKRFAQQIHELEEGPLETQDFVFKHPDRTEQKDAAILMASLRRLATKSTLWKASGSSAKN